jgi:hypothetical protein
MYRRVDAAVMGLTLAIHQVDDMMVSAADAVDRKVVLDGISSRVIFTIFPNLATLLYAINIEQMALYIHVHAQSYITSCLTKLGWEADSKDSSLMVPLSPYTVKETTKSLGPLDPAALALMVKKFGLKYRSLAGMLILQCRSADLISHLQSRSCANTMIAQTRCIFW